MTNYTDKEYSVHAGAPIEVYRFTGTLANYHYTSAEINVTVGGQLYTAIPISRSAVSVSNQEDDNQELEIEVPYDLDIIQEYVYTLAPARLGLEILRYHEGTNPSTDYIVLWKGYVTLYTISGHMAKLRVPSIFSLLLQGEVPGVWYHQPCNHVLFNTQCNASGTMIKANYKTTSTITIVDDRLITVVNDGVVNSWLRAGEIYNTTRTERRSIVDNVNNLITINYPFRNAVVGDTVDMYTGCDHLFTTCRDKFANSINYGGFPYIPRDNPFKGHL